MQRSRDILNHHLQRGHQVLALVTFLLLCACASPQRESFKLPPLLESGPEVHVDDVDVLAVSSEMDEFLRRYVMQYSNSQTKIHLLASTISGSGVLGFKYDPSRNLSAAEAFKTRSGNCVGFSNMMIALARRAGLKAHYQEIIRRPVWSMDDDTVLLVKHVNVVIEGTHMDYVMDASNIKLSLNSQRRIVRDSYAKALYLNNLGARALIENDLPTAYAYMKKAIEIEPALTDSWVNLSVVFGRNDQMDDAISVLQTALDIDGSQLSAMSNLYQVYVEQGNLEAAKDLEPKVERYRRNNPYYLLYLSDEALALDQYEESIKLLQRAIKKKDDDHKLHFALAKTQFLSGETLAAENSLSRARELAPSRMTDFYQRPLSELVIEAEEETQ